VEARAARSKLPVLFAGLLLAGAAGGLAAQFNGDLPAFVILALAQGAVWAVAAAIILRSPDRRPALALILGTAVLLRLIALAAPVFLSDDINRYIWDGRVQAAGINPYRYVPTDPELAPLRDRLIFPNINRNNYAPTIYPPVAQMLFAAANRFGETALAMKLMLAAIEGVGIGALLVLLRNAGKPLEQILLYAWHPLPVWEIAGSGHIDAAAVTFTALALAAFVGRRHGWSAVALAAATLVKLFPAVLAPALWRPAKSNMGDWRWPAAFIAVMVVGYLPYVGVGSRALGFLPGYLAEENFGSGSGFWLLGVVRRVIPMPLAAYLGLAASVMIGLAIGALRRAPEPRSRLPWAMALGTAALFFASPHYAWYFVWLVALLTAAPWWPAWWLTLAAFLLYCNHKTGNVLPWVGFTLYGGFVILCAADLVRRTVFNKKFGARRAVDCAS
jgi:alpha-1,6-mannosyltransferase